MRTENFKREARRILQKQRTEAEIGDLLNEKALLTVSLRTKHSAVDEERIKIIDARVTQLRHK